MFRRATIDTYRAHWGIVKGRSQEFSATYSSSLPSPLHPLLSFHSSPILPFLSSSSPVLPRSSPLGLGPLESHLLARVLLVSLISLIMLETWDSEKEGPASESPPHMLCIVLYTNRQPAVQLRARLNTLAINPCVSEKLLYYWRIRTRATAYIWQQLSLAPIDRNALKSSGIYTAIQAVRSLLESVPKHISYLRCLLVGVAQRSM